MGAQVGSCNLIHRKLSRKNTHTHMCTRAHPQASATPLRAHACTHLDKAPVHVARLARADALADDAAAGVGAHMHHLGAGVSL